MLFKTLSLNDMKKQKYVEDRKFDKVFDFQKISGARARLEYSTIYAKNPWFLGFHSDVRFSARRARKLARARFKKKKKS